METVARVVHPKDFQQWILIVRYVPKPMFDKTLRKKIYFCIQHICVLVRCKAVSVLNEGYFWCKINSSLSILLWHLWLPSTIFSTFTSSTWLLFLGVSLPLKSFPLFPHIWAREMILVRPSSHTWDSHILWKIHTVAEPKKGETKPLLSNPVS